jgi:hypothetical protein
MKRLAALLLFLASLVAQPALAQVEQTKQADGATLRGLDKLNGEVIDIELKVGFSIRFGSIRIELTDSRFPEDNPTGEAYAFLTMFEENSAGEISKTPMFRGWMIASSPALNALDHFRYDVWVMRCTMPEPEEAGDEEPSSD